jgi:hypothetical protein
MHFAKSLRIVILLIAIISLTGCTAFQKDQPLVPRIDGPWWQVAGNPDLGELNGPPKKNPDAPQQPVDFAVWQAADGTWQLWSCIRHTKVGGHTRLFYGWEGQELADHHWKPMGIQMRGQPEHGEDPGGMQAPHVVLIDDVYHMFYGDWDEICIARSRDGKNFERWLYPDGQAGMFDEGPKSNARDACALKIGNKWYCYYTAYPNLVGAVYCRTSKDLRNWSDSVIVSRGGQTGKGPSSAECPHVIYHKGWYYLFRTQRYTHPPTTSVYRSKDPLDFGVDSDEKFVCLLPVAAPEIIQHNGKHYIAALRKELDGMRIARLRWQQDVVAEK